MANRVAGETATCRIRLYGQCGELLDIAWILEQYAVIVAIFSWNVDYVCFDMRDRREFASGRASVKWRCVSKTLVKIDSLADWRDKLAWSIRFSPLAARWCRHDLCVADKFSEWTHTLSSELCAAYAVGMLIFRRIVSRRQHNLSIVLHHSRAKLLSSLTSGESSTCFRRL